MSIVADTETIMLAWFSLLQANLGSTFEKYDRKFGFFKDIVNQPALLIRKVGTLDVYDGDEISTTTIQGELWILEKVQKDVAGETKSNPLETAVRMAVKQLKHFSLTGDGTAFVTDGDGNIATEDDDADGFEPQTLDGLVYRARIEGQTNNDSGDFDGQAKVKIPFTILVPDMDD